MFDMTRKSLKLMQRGFTLIELLIVVIILAILSAILIPQFSTSSDDAKLAALDANLNGLRSAIELYRVQHNGDYPGAIAATGATCTVGAAGTGLVNTPEAVIDQLTKYSSADGKTCSGADPTTPLGPYIRKGIPVEPIKNNAAITLLTTTGAPLVTAGTAGGWAYDTKSGQIVMNMVDTEKDSKGIAYSAH